MLNQVGLVLPGVPIVVLSTNGTLCIENIFCFVHHLMWNINILKIWYTFHYFMKLCKHFGISLHKLLGGCVLPLVPKGNITLKYIGQFTGSGLLDHSVNLFDLILEYVYADGEECLLLAL